MSPILQGRLRRALVVEAPHASLDSLLSRSGFEVTRLDKVLDRGTLIDALRRTQAQVLFKRSRVVVDREVFEAVPDLSAIQLCCIGDDSVDKVAAADHGVMVFNDPVSNGRSVVELAVAHLIGLSRRLFETDVAMHRHHWDKSAMGRFEIQGKVLGIVGLGNIGRQVARVAEQLGCEILFHDTRLAAQEVGAEFGWSSTDDLRTLFRSSDMVTVHTSAFDAEGRDNVGLLDPYLADLGADRGASPRLFLNLARGNLHSSAALLDAIGQGAIARAAVDVYPEEPSPGAPAWQNPYADEPRVVCTPHIGASTEEAQPRIARRVAATMEAFSATGSVRDCVFQPRVGLPVAAQKGQVVLSVVHSVRRGTKKAVDDAIYAAGASNLGSAHQDFPIGVAYDVSVLDRPLSEEALAELPARAAALTGDPSAIRRVRQVPV